jgi:hypothetical protein
MSAKNMSLVISDHGVNTTKSLATEGRSPVKVKVHAGVKYLLVDDNGIAPENVTLTRAGSDLEVTAEGDSSPSLVLEGYFSESDSASSGLYGIAEDGQLYGYTPTNGTDGIYTLPDGGSAPAALGGDPLGAGAPYLENAKPDSGFAALPLFLLGGIAAAAGAIAVPRRPRVEQGGFRDQFECLPSRCRVKRRYGQSAVDADHQQRVLRPAEHDVEWHGDDVGRL